ncbi:hypothetical protein IKF81_02170 [Candidatus Saccharibacteria bacterium]|nr:hypothetical protein [Candidatus Saccharibacteria bacterium]
MVEAGKTIAGKRGRPESDSERERVRKKYKKQKILSVFVAIGLGALLIFLAVRAFQEWFRWISNKEEVIVIEREPRTEVVDETTGQSTTKLGSRMKTYIVNLEDEFTNLGYKMTRVRIPADKAREIDVEIEGFSGFVKIYIDRNPAVSAEDAVRMMKYLENQGISEVQYIDVRVERKGYWR